MITQGNAPPGKETRRVRRSIAGREIDFDAEGFFMDPYQWTKEMAGVLASEIGIAALEKNHWRVILFLREYFLQNGRAPLHRELKKEVGMSLLEIESLFPGGIKLGARRLAGLPNPSTCGM